MSTGRNQVFWRMHPRCGVQLLPPSTLSCVSIICCYAAVITFIGCPWPSRLLSYSSCYPFENSQCISDYTEGTNTVCTEPFHLTSSQDNVRRLTETKEKGASLKESDWTRAPFEYRYSVFNVVEHPGRRSFFIITHLYSNFQTEFAL